MVKSKRMNEKLPNSLQILRNSLYTFASIIVFFAGVIGYGVVLNLRETTLAEALSENGIEQITDVSIIIDRKNYTLNLYSGDNFLKSYRAVFGKNNALVKTFSTDNVTPIGKYVICKKDSNSQYKRFLQLNYPNERDAAEALKNGYISKDEYKKIVLPLKNNNIPCPETSLGGEIGIHGIGEYNIIFKNLPFAFNWTNGSVAISNEGIEELFLVTSIGTPVEIRN